MSEWEIPAEAAEGLVRFDLLMPRAEFRPAGSVSGITLVEHTCARPGPSQGIAYVSAVPSADDDAYVVPFCGCRPGPGTIILRMPPEDPDEPDPLDYEEMREGLPPP